MKIKVEPPFKYKKKFSFTEFLRQLKGQEKGLNKLTVEECLNNRDNYLNNGRSKEGTKAQREFRE